MITKGAKEPLPPPIGVPSLDLLERNASLARAFEPLPPAEMDQMADELSGRKKMALDRLGDAWNRPAQAGSRLRLLCAG
jgi:hypothetical protein